MINKVTNRGTGYYATDYDRDLEIRVLQDVIKAISKGYKSMTFSINLELHYDDLENQDYIKLAYKILDDLTELVHDDEFSLETWGAEEPPYFRRGLRVGVR